MRVIYWLKMPEYKTLNFFSDAKLALPDFGSQEGQHSMEGARAARPRREHDHALREAEGRLVDQRRALQQGAHQAGGHGGQDRLPQEPGPAGQAVPEGGAGAPAQLPQGEPTGSCVAEDERFLHILSKGGRVW